MKIYNTKNVISNLYIFIVMSQVNGYNDIAWVEIDLDKINGELQDFQAKFVMIFF